MQKSEIVLRVNTPIEVEGDHDDADLIVSAWDQTEKIMIDQHISEIFPEINNISGLEEVCEGDFSYYGSLSKEELIITLTKLGFIAK